MTLVELVVGTALLVGGGGALLLGMNYALMHSDYLNDYQIALNAAQSRLEEVSAQDFDTLIDASGPYASALTSGTGSGMCLPLDETDEDLNCNGALNAGEDLNANGILDQPLPSGHLSVRIQPFPPGAGTKTLATIRVTACWRTSRGRQIGEDLNCNGRLNAGEDGIAPFAPANGLLDSPVLVTTQVADSD